MFSWMELVVLAVAAYLGVRGWRAWQRHGEAGGTAESLARGIHERVECWARGALAAIRGHRGIWPQVLTIGAIVALVAFWPSSHFLGRFWLVAIAAGVVIVVMESMAKRRVESLKSVGTPPPLPPAATPPSPPPPLRAAGPLRGRANERDWEPREKRGRSWLRTVFVVLFVLVAASFLTGRFFVHRASHALGRVRDELRSEMARNPEVRAAVENMLDDAGSLSRIHPPPIVAPVNPVAPTPPTPPHPENGVRSRVKETVKEALSNDAVKGAVAGLRDALASDPPADVSQESKPPLDVPVVSYKPEGEFVVPSAGVKVAFTTEECSSQQEADVELVEQVSRFLALSLAKSGKQFDLGAWHPGSDWTARYFAPKRTIQTRQNQQTGATLFRGEVTVDTPTEQKLEQIWDRYLHDQASSRSFGLLKAYSGVVFLVGGMAVFLRLGTGRHVKPGQIVGQRRSKGVGVAVAAIGIVAAAAAAAIILGFLVFGIHLSI